MNIKALPRADSDLGISATVRDLPHSIPDRLLLPVIGSRLIDDASNRVVDRRLERTDENRELLNKGENQLAAFEHGA
jgi:hypothetical protein